MATRRIVPPDVRDVQPQAEGKPQFAPRTVGIRRSTAAQIVIAAAVLLVICYLAKLVLVTLMVSVLLAFVLEPLVRLLERIRLPRSVGAFVAVLVLLAAIYGASYFFYNRAVSFAQELPQYSQKIRGMLSHVTQRTNQLQQATENVLPEQQLFPAESRTTAYLAVFGFLKLPYFYFLGFISGFLSLVPYLGVILALFPPLTAGLGSLNTTKVLVIVLTVLGLHLLAMNVLYPKVIGRRLQLNPLIVTIGLLVWGFIWGAMGLILAVPILGAIKIICDHVPNLRPLGEWMGE